MVLSAIRSLLAALGSSLTPPKVLHSHPVVWSFPTAPMVKLNVDGSVRGNPGPAGAGVLIQDCHSTLLAASSISLASCSNMEAEILAAHHGVFMALQLGFSHFVLESDLKMLVDWLHLKLPWPWKFYHLLYAILGSLNDFHVQTIHFL